VITAARPHSATVAKRYLGSERDHSSTGERDALRGALAEFLGEARAKAADHLHGFSSFASRRAFGA